MTNEWLIRLNIDSAKLCLIIILNPLNTQYHIMDDNNLRILEKLNSINDIRCNI